ncbi:MAG: trk system potassium uptake protein TrkA [Spirochaetes bacterium]|nr:MAG: trk system potassium uptake protein TrkA [Spirochaetota bacterium]
MDRVIIVGAGKVGFHLAKVLKSNKYDVALVEKDAARGAEVAQKIEIGVFLGEGTDIQLLRSAGVERAEYFISVTGNDADNLVACQIAKSRFNVRHSIARVIDPNNESLFRRLGVDAVISTTALAAQTISNLFPANGLRLISIFDRGDLELAEVALTEHSLSVGKKVSEILLPEECLLVAILREETVFLPRGNTILQPFDRIFAMVQKKYASDLRGILAGGKL